MHLGHSSGARRSQHLSAEAATAAEFTDHSSDLSACAEEAQRRLEGMGSELDQFIRLRSYILHMQEGASLLLWKEDGLQLCWFWLDKDCHSLNWDVDETASATCIGDAELEDRAAGEGWGGRGAEGGSLLLDRIVDIVPLGAGADQLTDSPTDSSFSVQLENSRLDIVAPTSLDFQVCVCVRVSTRVSVWSVPANGNGCVCARARPCVSQQVRECVSACACVCVYARLHFLDCQVGLDVRFSEVVAGLKERCCVRVFVSKEERGGASWYSFR